MNDAPLSVDLDETAAAPLPAPATAADPGVDVDEARESEEELAEGVVRLTGAEARNGAAFQYALRYPVTLTVKGGNGEVRVEVYGTLTLYRITAADFDAALNSGKDSTKTMVLRSTRLPLARAAKVWEKMDGVDLAAVTHTVSTFLLGTGRKTGR